jgi:hypothetical protein
MIAAALPFGEVESVSSVKVARTGTTQMDRGR